MRALIEELNKMPGIGARSAERLAFYILKSEQSQALRLAEAIVAVKQSLRHCDSCYNLSDTDQCAICANPKRDHSRVLVVEQPKDLIALELTGMYKGLYHVLMGRLSPLDGIGPGDLTIIQLLARVDAAPGSDHPRVEEVILGLNPTVEGDGTALYLADELRGRRVLVSRLARGLPTGGMLEYANKAVLADAIQGRQSVE
ncbi:MAG: recombination protein RecR [Phycisphaerales bacterium]|nr:recombination protein RecR [Phycisphaerales bacterium]